MSYASFDFLPMLMLCFSLFFHALECSSNLYNFLSTVPLVTLNFLAEAHVCVILFLDFSCKFNFINARSGNNDVI
jgi:TRAP-type mannitol/chloroaromatic compound transport system permease large subunit